MTALGYALIAAGANLVGGLVITTASPRGRALQRVLIAFGAGFMLAVVVLAMVPHALEGGPNAAAVILLGYVLVHLTQHVLTHHFHFGEERHPGEMLGRWVGVTALLGLLLHAFFDGVAIAGAFGVGATLGLLVFGGIVLHKIPEGVTIASIMLASGNGRLRALLGAGAIGAATVAGVLATEWIAPLRAHGLALSAGVTLYVAASNLIPEVQRERGARYFVAVALGLLSYFLAAQVLRDFVS